MKIIVSLTDNRPEPWIEGLKAELPEAQIETWQPGAAQADHAVVWAPPQQLLDEQPQLRGLFNIGAGVDALLKLKVPPQTRIVRLDDAGMSVQMAEYVCHALLRHLRRFDDYEAQARQGQWQQHAGRPRRQFPVGVMGLGVLGKRVVQAVQHFGFPVRGWSRSRKEIAGIESFAGGDGFKACLSGAHILVCLLPLTDDTRGILNAAAFAPLAHGAILVHAARGAHLVEADLMSALQSGRLSRAILDVFATEPLPSDHPFWRHPQVTVTPHVAAITRPGTGAADIVENYRRALAGEPLINQVDRVKGY